MYFMNQNAKYPTLVLGASDNPQRYSNLAIHLLDAYGHPVYAVGKKQGKSRDIEIHSADQIPDQLDIHTVSVYLNPLNQIPYYSLIQNLKPKRVIFNPGSENYELQGLLDQAQISWEHACTLVLLRTQQF